MEFMEMLEEWLELREIENAEEDWRSIQRRSDDRRSDDRKRKCELAEEINKRMRGEL